MTDTPDIAALGRRIAETAPRPPKIGLILGSGLAPLAETLIDTVALDFADLPGFPAPTVEGHGGKLVMGTLGGLSTVMLRGRAHYYEHGEASVMQVPIRALHAAGCDTLILTNAAGSVSAALPGTVGLITDHINLSGANPLIGYLGADRFVDMTNAYDAGLLSHARHVAEVLEIPITEGVYAWVSGPSFETPAEIRMLRNMGADYVGMSTVPETIIARQVGMRVAAFSAITNMGAGLSDEALSHAHTQDQALAIFQPMAALITGLITQIGLEGQPEIEI